MEDLWIKYDEPFDVAYQRHLRELREFAARYRKVSPLPRYEQLTSEQRAQYRVLRKKMEQFTPYSPFSEKHLAIVHSTPAGLLAAREVFQPHSNCMVLLLFHERKKWFENPDHYGRRLFWTFWWNFHEKISPETNEYVRSNYPIAENERLWRLNSGRGGNASSEIWRWDGNIASYVCPAGGMVTNGYFVEDEYL